MSTLTIHTDGGARGNPGPAGIGVVFNLPDWKWHHKRYIGNATNNIAEYTAILDAIHHLPQVCEEHGPVSKVEFFLDSELVVRQLLGQYKVKEPTLQSLCQTALKKLGVLTIPYTITHVRREYNKAADLLVNQALDEHFAA